MLFSNTLILALAATAIATPLSMRTMDEAKRPFMAPGSADPDDDSPDENSTNYESPANKAPMLEREAARNDDYLPDWKIPEVKDTNATSGFKTCSIELPNFAAEYMEVERRFVRPDVDDDDTDVE